MAYNFINPYNFVPLGKGKSKVGNSEERNLKGVIEYTLLTKTPLFIPNTSNDHAILPEEAKGKKDDSYHKSYEFFAYEDLSGLKEPKEKEDLLSPVIPGSEIRGMLRSYYEILSNSCMSAIDDNVTLSRRNAHVFKAGLIRRIEGGKYVLETKVDDCLLRTKGANSLVIQEGKWKDEYADIKSYMQKDILEGQKIYVSVNRDRRGKPLVTSVNTSNKGKEGYIIKGEHGPELKDKKNDNKTMKGEKHCAHVFIKKASSDEIHIDINILEEVLRIYSQNNENAYKEYKEEWEKYKKGNKNEYFPVYYSIPFKNDYIDNNHIVYLSPASITREVYNVTLTKMIGLYKSCNEKDSLCPSCALFGTLNTGKTGVASRIRIADAGIDGILSFSEVYDNVVSLKELSSPKLGNVEFYLKKPKNAWFWTYDYYTDGVGKIHPYKAEINGRKFYWHNINVKEIDYKAEEKNERNCTIRPVKKGVKFKGKIFFDGISERELNELIYLVNAGDDTRIENKEYGYKLGKGKPYGLGSIAMHVDKVTLRNIVLEKAVCYNELDFDKTNPTWDKEIESCFKKMSCFELEVPSEYNISYPKKYPNDSEPFKWFVDNHKAYRLDKKTEEKIKNKSPNSRSQLYFNEYIEAMEPVLINTEIDKLISKSYNKHNYSKKR